MSKFVIFILLNIFLYINCQNAKSPCPSTYGYNKIGDKFYKFIRLITTGSVKYHSLKVKMSVATQNISSYDGKIERLLNATSRFKCALFFQVFFPSINLLPNIELITYNNMTLCTGPPAKGDFITTLTLEHETTYDCSEDDNSINTSSLPITAPESAVSTRKITGSKVSALRLKPAINKLNSICGLPIIISSVVKEKVINRWVFPWLAAIFDSGNFICGGNLISSKHILTAAHCFYDKEIDKSSLFVRLGQIGLSNSEISISVDSINIHPDYRKIYFNSPDADIAILTLGRSIVFSNVLHPVCLYSEGKTISDLIKQSAIIAGWSKRENSLSGDLELKLIYANITSPEDCTSTYSILSEFRSFCAGADTIGPCNGNSSGDLFLINNNMWYIKGIKSLISDTYDNESYCESLNNVLYTDISLFLEWILSFINN